MNIYYARYYDPRIGHFTQADTVVPDPADPQAYNRYQYVRNDPTNNTDPSGHVATWQYVEGGVTPTFHRGREHAAASYRVVGATAGDPLCAIPGSNCGPAMADLHDQVMAMSQLSGVSPALLAMVIYSEGGNVRRMGDLRRLMEMFSSSKTVGIGNIAPRNATALDPSLSLEEARTLLIWNDEFSIEVAAFVLAQRRALIDPDYRTDRNLFLAYAVYEREVLRLNSLGWDVAAFGDPDLHYRSSVLFPAAFSAITLSAEVYGLWGGLGCVGGVLCPGML